jgi:L-alanine-DL-glutamate epimerase-like enolase superfamily enzyme
MALYRLFGGYRDTVPYYVTCAYYRDGKTIPEIKDELQQLKSKGHRAFKAKVGGLPLKEDIARIEAIREVIGADDDLMIDVNRGWSLQTAIEGARLLEPLNVRWLEEPVRWNDDHRELRLLAQQTKIPLSGGESELTMFRCRDLIEDHAIQILQADSTMSGGYTALKKLAALCELNQVHLAPHHDCFLHAPRIVARRTHSGIVRRGSRSLTGRAVRKSAEDWKGCAHNCSDCARSPNADHRVWPRPS